MDFWLRIGEYIPVLVAKPGNVPSVAGFLLSRVSDLISTTRRRAKHLFGEDCLYCYPLGANVMQILQNILSGNFVGALQQTGAIPNDGIDCESGACQVNPIMDAGPADPQIGTNIFNCPDANGNDPCAAKWHGAGQLNNPCTLGLFYVTSGSGAALGTVDGTAVVATAETYGVPATAGLSWLYRLNPATSAATVARWVGTARRAVQSACNWIASANW